MAKRRRKLIKWTWKKILILFFLVIVGVFIFTATYTKQPLSDYANQKANFHGTILINDSIRTKVISNLNVENLIIMNKRLDGHISSVQVNTLEINNVLAEVGAILEKELINLENSKDSPMKKIKIPLGATFQNSLLTNIGPKITLQVIPIGSVKTNIETKVVPYGINNSTLEINLIIEVVFKIIAPFKQSDIRVRTSVPLLVEIIAGEVPRYYYYAGGGYVPSVPNDDISGPASPTEPTLPSD